MNVPFGGALTGVAALPPGSQRDLIDPFAEKKSPWPKVIVFVVLLVIACLVLNKMGYIYDWTDGRLGTERPTKAQKTTVVPAAPAAPTEAPAKPAETAK
jgi:hypothetical protein